MIIQPKDVFPVVWFMLVELSTATSPSISSITIRASEHEMGPYSGGVYNGSAHLGSKGSAAQSIVSLETRNGCFAVIFLTTPQITMWRKGAAAG